MTVTHRRDIETIFFNAVKSVLPQIVMPKQLRIVGPATVRIGARTVPIPATGVFIVAIGKASIQMTKAAEQTLGEYFSDGIMVSKALDHHVQTRSKLYLGAHPVPDDSSVLAGEAVLKFVESIPNGSLVLCLISGGGSSLVEAPLNPVSLEEIQDITDRLLLSGATITELNAVRSRLSEIKGGGLLDRLSHTSVHNLIISDVIGDDPEVIASGPTVQGRGATDAKNVLDRYGLAIELPERRCSKAEPVQTTIVANLGNAIATASEKAVQLGYSPVILSRSLQGEAREVAGVFASIATDTARGRTGFSPRTCLIAGGETTVTVSGNGVGGRNTESALAASIVLREVLHVSAGFLATDGDDGMSGVAGSIVDGATIRDDNIADAIKALQENDSYTFLESFGLNVRSGPTGTNVNDLFIALTGRQTN